MEPHMNNGMEPQMVNGMEPQMVNGVEPQMVNGTEPNHPRLPGRYPRLGQAADWDRWLDDLHGYATFLGIWNDIDPNRPEQPDDKPRPPNYETVGQVAERMRTERLAANLAPPTEAEVIAMHRALARDSQWYRVIYKDKLALEDRIRTWMGKSVEGGLLTAAVMAAADITVDFSLRQLLICLQGELFEDENANDTSEPEVAN